MKFIPTVSCGLKNRGFALVVTLSLMILLTIIAVGLLTLSSISLRSASNSSAMATARQNARLAMMLALGELQKYGGQDQRATAIADIAGAADGTSLAAGGAPLNDNSVNKVSKRLSAVQPGTRYWTGIFVNQDIPNSIFTRTPAPLNIHWLVSGVNSSYSLATPTGGPNIFPSDPAYAVGSSGSVSDATKAVVLAGKNTVGSSPGFTDRCVVAPLVGIIDKTTSKLNGRFAWWVGDEGVKASINLDKTLTDPTQYASLSAQRRGWETVTGLSAYPTPTSGSHSLPKITDLNQAALLLPGAGAALQNIFHSATADSRAVLCDSLNGGTKIDLSAILSQTLPASVPGSASAIVNYPVQGKNIIPNSASSTIQAPKWDAVKAFNDRYSQLSSGSLAVKAATSNSTAAIAPVITDFRLLLGARMKVRADDPNKFNINACGKIAIAIANPYSVPLKWTNDLEFEVVGVIPPGNDPSRILNLGSSTAYFGNPNNASAAAVFNHALFHISASSLAPGEARAYTIPNYTLRPIGTGASPLVVTLTPFASSAPFDFTNCIELDNSSVYTCVANPKDNNIPYTPSMDVRESWTTSPITLAMRLAGSSNILRQVERFELDNGYFQFNIRSFRASDAAQITKPFPLMCYSFQLSQPGMDYLPLLPPGYALGQRASTLRTFADFNLQATHLRKPIASYNPTPYFMQSSDSNALLPNNPPGGETGTPFTSNLAVSPLPWGRSPTGSQKTILFSVPSQISSLAQLQHADLTGDDLYASVGHQPGNAMANSYATPFVKRELTSQTRTEYVLVGAPNHSGTTNTSAKYYDISYLLNASLWDTYFFSTIPASGPAQPQIPTLVALNTTTTTLKDPVNAATQLMIDGAFNVNSTDVNAWKAFLASAKDNQVNSGPASATDAAFPRSLEQISSSTSPPTGSDADSFSGYRRLTDAQLDALATEIVKQVRLRGPFVSLSHFVNRALAPITTQAALTRGGALQQAIDESGANINFAGNKNAFSRISASGDAVTLQWKGSAPRADLDGGNSADRPTDADPSHPDWALSSTDRNDGAVASIVADQQMLSDPTYQREQGYRSTGIPGWLTQADVFQVIGNSLTTRSDTFRIRTYGEALDSSGKSVAKAYCEAIVQRFPDYIDPTNATSVRGTALSALNQSYGRKYQIISFRWLTAQEI